jgi:hypothetical protein
VSRQPRKCTRCNEEFTPRDGTVHQKICRPECPITRTCKHCKSPFWTPHQQAKYCCLECRNSEYSVNKPENRWRAYGITEDQYYTQLELQGGHCAICPESNDLVVDHDNACCDRTSRRMVDGTMKRSTKSACGECFRGILCRQCNIGLGGFRDQEDYTMRATTYLREFRERKTSAN